MSRIRSKNTKPDIIVRRYLYSKGFRYRLHNKKLSGNPDLSNFSKKIAIFINGCFWHRHGCSYTTTPKTNTDYWKNKFNKTISRDKKNHENLINNGWKVLIIWECQVDSQTIMNQKFSEII